MLSPLGNLWELYMRARSSLKSHHRSAVDLAADPISVEALLRARPRMTAGMVEFLVREGLLMRVPGGVQAVPGLREAKHAHPPQALQAASVWEYARRCV